MYDREVTLRSRLSSHLSRLTGHPLDSQNIGVANLLQLKSLLSDINNYFTMLLTLKFLDWAREFYSLSEAEGLNLAAAVRRQKPNANGFDVKFNSQRRSFISEIKCIVPINQGQYFGAAQRNAILDDAVDLLAGKPDFPDTHNAQKFVTLLDLGEKTDSAIVKLLTPAQSVRTKNPTRLNRHKVVHSMRSLPTNASPNTLETTFVYLLRLALE